jgi:hypothetical protein
VRKGLAHQRRSHTSRVGLGVPASLSPWGRMGGRSGLIVSIATIRRAGRSTSVRRRGRSGGVWACGVAPRECGAENGTSPRNSVGCESPDLILTAAERAYVLQDSLLRRTGLLQRDQTAARSDFITRCSPSCYSRTALVGARLAYPAVGHGHPSHSPLCPCFPSPGSHRSHASRLPQPPRGGVG